ncbi:uncharacterized protein LOC122858852 isoform X2 [Aphidius gifuensis]|uniref:uncharacterized protein LOC122858852 isoform X2 n=1 Tax=Aphidius gifuensis TaxID=684658 RepID=UPI001CDC6909|nr:uncharacterized protein LOC122858852 isoform X2 [Aphidius gifuensis]
MQDVCKVLMIKSSPVRQLLESQFGIEEDNEIIKNLNSREDKLIDDNENNEDKKNETTLMLFSDSENNSTMMSMDNYFSSLIQPFIQKLKFSPKVFFQDQLKSLKNLLNNYKIDEVKNLTRSKRQLSINSGLLHLIGLEDHGFYTDRLEPQGLLGGNGWFSNKGGLLGGPGAIFSTGSVLTDYPSPY